MQPQDCQLHVVSSEANASFTYGLFFGSLYNTSRGMWCRSLPCLLLVVVVPLMAIPRSYSDPGPNPREQDDDAAVRVPPLPLSEPARPMRDPPWTPAEERNDPNTRHMAAGVAVALRLLMRNHAALGPIPDAFDEHRSARARVPLPFGNALTSLLSCACGSHDLCAIERLPRAPPLRWGSAGVRHFGLRIPRQSTARRRSHTRTARKSPPIQRSRIGRAAGARDGAHAGGAYGPVHCRPRDRLRHVRALRGPPPLPIRRRGGAALLSRVLPHRPQDQHRRGLAGQKRPHALPMVRPRPAGGGPEWRSGPADLPMITFKHRPAFPFGGCASACESCTPLSPPTSWCASRA